MQQGMRNKMAMMGGNMGPMGMTGGPPGGPGGGPMGYGSGMGPNSSSSVAQWVHQQNQNLQEQGLNMNEGDPRMIMGPNPNFSQMMMDERGIFDPEFAGGQMNNNLMQSKVPNESLTPEQLQRREEHLASLRKIQQMLFPERSQQGFPPGGPGGPGQGPGPGMMSDMGMYQQSMMSQKRAMMGSQQNMIPSPHGMVDSQQEMMSREHFMMSQGMSQYGPGPGPQNMQNMTPAQREWFRLQQEHYAQKQMQQRSMGPNGSQRGSGMDPSRGMQGPPPPYYIAQQQRHGSVGMGSPTSPSMNGPMGSPAMAGDPSDPLMFQGHQRKGSFSGIDPLGPMGPGMGPGGLDPMMQQGSPMNPNMMGTMGTIPPHGLKTSQVSLQRAGNPEQFVPDLPPSTGGTMSNNSTNKPPPSYAQSQSTKRKRDKIDDMEELCKNLQPTPSPQHISYLNQFDGQELTITKQYNSAYRDTTNSSESQSNHFTQANQVVNSPLHGPASNKGPMSNSSQTSSGPLGSPGPVSGSQGSGQGPGPSPMPGANMRLSHYDPQQQQQTQPQNSSISNSPTTPTGKSSLSNITSASLANLAKGVENLSNQMQQHMMQGGPFHSIQMQSQQQQSSGGASVNPHPQTVPHTSSSNASQSNNQVTHAPTSNTSQTQSTPSVNNTYVNANLSIQQVNIQSVNHGNGSGSGSNFNSSSNSASMHVQQMNMEQSQMNTSAGMQSCANVQGTVTQTGGMSQARSMTPGTSITQTSNVQQNSKISNSGMQMGMKDSVPMSVPNSQGFAGGPPSAGGPVNSGNMGPPQNMQNKMSMFAQQSQQNAMTTMMNQQVPTSGRPGSPGYPPSSMGNANVQIQQKAPNTIQYLPANQSNMPPETTKTMKPDLEFMNQFNNPMMGMEGPGGKVPTSKMQYFQGAGGGSSNPFGSGPGSMGPGPGPDSRIGPGMMGMGGDSRFAGQSMSMGSDPRIDPRMVPNISADPRMGPVGAMSRPENRMGPDMGMSPDPRMTHGPMGPMSDPRMGPSSNSMMGMAPSSMRPGSRGSPFTGPIGPAVQQSMMMRRGSPDIAMGSSNFSAISGMGSPDPLNPSMNNMGPNPMSALSSMSGNPMTSMSSLSNSIMSDQMVSHISGGASGPSGPGMGHSMPYNSPPYNGPMGGSMMPSGPGSMQGPRMQGPGMGGMSRSGPYSRQTSPGMRMAGPGAMGPGPLSPGNPGYSSAQYQQFQQQLYSQGRPRQMSPMESMMGNPGGPGPSYGPMGPGMASGMMPNMHGPM